METVDENVDYGRKIRRMVRMTGATLLAFEPLSERSSRFTTVQYLDAGGHIPAWVVNQKLPESLSIAMELREEFARDDEIDEIGAMIYDQAMRQRQSSQLLGPEEVPITSYHDRRKPG